VTAWTKHVCKVGNVRSQWECIHGSNNHGAHCKRAKTVPRGGSRGDSWGVLVDWWKSGSIKMIYGGQGKTTCNAMDGTNDKRIAGDSQLDQNCMDNASS
jgi:hypothetical protein